MNGNYRERRRIREPADGLRRPCNSRTGECVPPASGMPPGLPAPMAASTSPGFSRRMVSLGLQLFYDPRGSTWRRCGWQMGRRGVERGAGAVRAPSGDGEYRDYTIGWPGGTSVRTGRKPRPAASRRGAGRRTGSAPVFGRRSGIAGEGAGPRGRDGLREARSRAQSVKHGRGSVSPHAAARTDYGDIRAAVVPKVQIKNVCLKMPASNGGFFHVLLKACFAWPRLTIPSSHGKKKPPFPGRERGVRFGQVQPVVPCGRLPSLRTAPAAQLNFTLVPRLNVFVFSVPSSGLAM